MDRKYDSMTKGVIQLKCKLYIAKTYFLENESLVNERLTAISTDLDDLKAFIRGIRKLPVVFQASDVIYTSQGAVCMIESAEFFSEDERDAYLYHEKHEPYILQEYGRIDRYFANLSKKESKHVALPAILIDAIESRNEEFLAELKTANHTLRELLLYINGNDRSQLKINPDSVCILRTCGLIDKLCSKKEERLTAQLYERSPMLFCDEHEYRTNIDMALFNREMRDRYREILHDPYS